MFKVRCIQRPQRLPSRCRCTWTRLRTLCRETRESKVRALFTRFSKKFSVSSSRGRNEPPASTSELVEQRHHLASAGAAQRMTEGDGSTVRVHLLHRDAQFLHAVNRLRHRDTERQTRESERNQRHQRDKGDFSVLTQTT